jgi:putative restriction endonuclease
MTWESECRLAAFKYIAELEQFNDVIAGTILGAGFTFRGRTINLKGQSGIWKPKGFKYPISITSRSNGIYQDAIDRDGIITYSYRGTNPNHSDNRALRDAYEDQIPLILFNEVRQYHYQATWPIVIFEDNPNKLYIKAVVEPEYSFLNLEHWTNIGPSSNDVRKYASIQTKQRLHQRAFREIVLHAYQEKCTMCNLKHRQLLEAAHIIPDSEERGLPIIKNGLSLCKIHHAAFDHNILGIDANYIIHVKREILEESDGPMLQHGIKELNKQKIILPRNRKDHPEKEYLDYKFHKFLLQN